VDVEVEAVVAKADTAPPTNTSSVTPRPPVVVIDPVVAEVDTVVSVTVIAPEDATPTEFNAPPK